MLIDKNSKGGKLGVSKLLRVVRTDFRSLGPQNDAQYSQALVPRRHEIVLVQVLENKSLRL